ncbi:MAG: sporulation protein YqfD [Bacillota bacterium]|nr:sporulation protein YqfD [Bacillota bacterium]
MKNSFQFNRYKKGIIVIEAYSRNPERFINLLWKNGVYIKRIRRINISTLRLEVKLSDYGEIQKCAARTQTKMKILDRKGLSFFVLRLRNRTAMVIGAFLFIGIIYYLSTFIWGIQITTENNVSPYEIREQLKTIGIVPGINKKNINVHALEDKITDINPNVIWAKVRIEGSELKVIIAERHSPPNIVNDNTACNLVAKKDGQILRVFTTAGTAVVKSGDIVRKGQVIVKGEQGGPNSIYQVHAKGEVIAKTYNEKEMDVPLKKINRERTGKEVESIYINIWGKNIYFKKGLNKFAKYDKIIEDNHFIKKEKYYEVQEKTIKLDRQKVINDAVNKMYAATIKDFDKSIKVLNKIVDVQDFNDKCRVRLLVITEENIVMDEKMQ